MTSEALLDTDAGDCAATSPPDLPASSTVELGLLGRSLAFHVRKAQLILQRRGLRNISAMHVAPAEFGTMVLCEENPGLAQFQVAAALDIDKASVVAVVDRLEELGWLLRRRSSRDRRRHGLHLTAEGQRQVQLLRAQSEQAESFAKEILSPAEFTQLLALLARLR